jgi:hypothetical protein
MKTSWKDIGVGEFFSYQQAGEEVMLFLKVEPKENFNAVLLNKGILYNIHPNSELFKRVEVSFDIGKELE